MFTETSVKTMCCICGVPIDPNPTGMCVDCLRQNYSISDQLPQTTAICYCRGCGRYQQSLNKWIHASLESPELMKICLSHVTNLKDFKIVDSKFLFTEPHSRRLKISLTLEFETPEKVELRQTVILTFVVNLLQCPDCQEAATPRAHWNSNVQLRQGGNSKRSLFWLEQQILSARAHAGCTGILRVSDGLDFQYADKASASKLVNFIKTKMPVLTKESGKLMSENFQSMTADVRFSFLVRIPPFSRQDLIILPPELVKASGNRSYIALVHRMGKVVRLVDPLGGRFIDVDSATYWKRPFDSILTHNDLRRFVVLDIDIIETNDRDCRFKMADVEITDEETYEDHIIVRTHLGGKLREGCVVLCYDRRVSCLPDAADSVFKKRDLPDVIIAGRATEKKRKFAVKELAPHNSDDNDEFHAFVDELVDDNELRQDVMLFKDGTDEIANEAYIASSIEDE